MIFWRRFTVTSSTDLQGLRILITRPEGRNEELRSALVAAGAQVWVQPLLRIVPLAENDERYQHARRCLLDLDLYQHIIFISVNAVACGMALIDDLWPQYPLGVRCHAIGAATAKALHDWPWPAGALTPLEAQQGGAMDSDSLLASAAFNGVDGQRVLIVRGCGGREQLAQKLRERNARVDYAECYQRCGPGEAADDLQSQLEAASIQLVCLNSGDTLQQFTQRIAAARRDEYHLVLPSARVQQLAQEAGFRHTLLAENAGTAATLAAIKTWQREHNVGNPK